MSKSSSNAAVGAKPAEAAAATFRKSPHGPHHDASRETFESIAFAFVLALLFRTFVAEAFVIPTGSMAPTLFGRNKDVVCEECHYHYQVGASDELNDDGYLVRRIDDSICPNCRHQNKIRDLLAFKGDRILVNKFPYQLGEPQRWDVIVFRYPEDPQKNYIKRLVGLPGEAIKISRGDVYARKDDQGEYQILRKQNPDKQKVLQQLVYDDRYPPVDLLAKGWPERWAAMTPSANGASTDKWVSDEQSWRHDAKARSFSIESGEEKKWVRYQHLIPQRGDWTSAGETNEPHEPRPELITDFCGYNAYSGGRGPNFEDDRFWVGDLTLNCTVEITAVKGPNAELVLELVEGVRRYRCQVDVNTGTATLLRNDELSADPYLTDVVMASAPTPIRGAGKYTLTFANVDDRLCFWVNGGWLRSGLIPFGEGAEFMAPANRNPQPADLNPAGFAVSGMTANVSNLLLQRDIYYRAESVPNNDYDAHEQELSESVRIRDSLTNPAEYGDLYSRKSREATFRALSSDEFFVMGDNSPRSQDSRLWPNSRHALNRHAVPRQALLGKAFFIYWPHGVPFLNNGKGFKILNHSPYQDQMGKPYVDTYPEYVFPFYPQWWRWMRIR
ncbi:signal peptidase I [Schlesneria paludicola]|uniref:signal peptidase I n=1 Tax=Schlesneria paludicola TaxID=360056 RepID=UPI00029B259E|nr:signal peptidase I [Schlesneria paludicola]